MLYTPEQQILLDRIVQRSQFQKRFQRRMSWFLEKNPNWKEDAKTNADYFFLLGLFMASEFPNATRAMQDQGVTAALFFAEQIQKYLEQE